MLPEKPEFGSPCNGCGWCCTEEICQFGEVAFPDAVAPCPGLIADGARTYCQLILVEKEAGLLPIIQDMLGTGKGCCSKD